MRENRLPRIIKDNRMKEHEGTLFGFFETGCEGTIPALQEDGLEGYDGLRYIEPDDHLTIYKDGEEIFSGIIKAMVSWEMKDTKPIIDEKDFFVGWVRYPGNPEHGQLCINSFWVHWLPTNVGLRLWYDVFFYNPDKYRGKLRKGKIDN
jgi:hypothetical protein